mgnify:CR=1 FL=1
MKVEPGLGGGAYGPAVYHDFYTAPYGPGSTYCPDLAVVVDLGGDGVNDLVLAWFHSNIGVPWEGDILVLRNFQKVAVLPGMTFPSFLKTADLNGDGLTDVYEDYGDDHPFVSYLNTPSGDLVLGPLQGPCSQADYHLADYNENGKLDLLVGHYSGCDWQGRSEWGATVILDDGTRVPVYDGDSAPGSDGRWWVGDPIDHNGDGHLDVVAVDGDTHEVVKAYHGDGQGGFAAAK